MRRAFISFDFDHDEDLRNLLVGQSRHPDTPFEIADWSLKEHLTGDWISKVRQRIARTEVTIVICSGWTSSARGVAIELDITRQLGHPYFLLWGRSGEIATKPSSALATDTIYQWTWDNLKALVAGRR